LQLEPAWLDFLVVDITCRDQLTEVKVPPWKVGQDIATSDLSNDL